jgi:hypothetical protein
VEATLKRRLAGGAAGLALLAGAGGAYAVSSGGSGAGDREAFVNNVAKRLNVSPEDLQAAFKGALSDKLDADVAAGRLTREQADQIEKRLNEHGGLPFIGPPPGAGRFHAGPPPGPGERPLGPPPLGGHHGPGGPIMAGLDAAAKYLGLTERQLVRRLRAGKSLAEVATDRSKPVAGLKSAIEDTVKASLDKAVDDKQLTAEQRDKVLSELRGRLDEIVNRKPGDGPPRGAHRWKHRPHW